MPIRSTVRTGALATLLAGVLTLTACGSSKNPSTGPTATTQAPSGSSTASVPGGGSASTTMSAAPANPADEQEIRTAFTSFFDPKTSAEDKMKLLQNGDKFASVIKAQADSPLAKSTKATVSKVTLVNGNQANVVYSISLAGQVALPNQTGTAVNEGGTWKVSDSTFCALLALQGTHPSACSGVSSAAPSASSS